MGRYLKPFSAVLKGGLPKNTHGTISQIIKNMTDLLDGDALKELLPDSGFFKNLRDTPQRGVSYTSFGGTNPGVFTVYIWKREYNRMISKPLLTIPDSLLKILPSFVVADEITPRKGDGLVTAESSLFPWKAKHYNLNVNHISVLWNRETINNIVKVLQAI